MMKAVNIESGLVAQTPPCPRCSGRTITERCYTDGEMVWQYRCVLCGWRDVADGGDVTAREHERQEQRAATDSSTDARRGRDGA